MADCRYNAMIAAYHDGELNEQDQQMVRDHLTHCPACSAELAELQEVSSLFAVHADARSTPLSQIEVARLHQNLQPARILANQNRSTDRDSSEIWRIAGVLSALAASVLIVSAAWLVENPSRRPGFISPVDPGPSEVAKLTIPAWERMAVDLKVDQRPVFLGDQTGTARAYFGNSDLSDDMLGLTNGQMGGNHANP